MQPTSGRTRTPLFCHTGTAGRTSKTGLAPASAPTQPRLRHDHHGHPPFLDITAQPPRSGLSTHSAPFGLDHSDRPSRAPLLYITACSSTPHSSRTENLRPSAAASPHKPYDSNIMLAMLEPATRTSCSPCWSPRLEHHARRGAVARAHPEGCSTTPNTSLGRSRPSTHTPPTHGNDIEVHHTHELRPHSIRPGHPSYLDSQDERRFHPSEGPTGAAIQAPRTGSQTIVAPG